MHNIHYYVTFILFFLRNVTFILETSEEVSPYMQGGITNSWAKVFLVSIMRMAARSARPKVLEGQMQHILLASFLYLAQ
jgi:hypothetical protein